MGLFRTYDSCKGVLLYKFGQYTAELWYCPAGYKIPEHSHPNEEIELMFLFGNTVFYRRPSTAETEQSFIPKWKHIFCCFGVPAGWSHRFSVGRLPLLFINFAKWKAGIIPTSASVDFTITKY